MKKYIFFGIIFICLCNFVVAGSETLQCAFKDSCDSNEAKFLYANENFLSKDEGLVLSSNIAVSQDDDYSKILCCKSQFGNLKVEFEDADVKCSSGEELMYFTDDKNARVRFVNPESDDELLDFNLSNYKYKTCVEKPEEFSLFDIVASEEDYTYAGYTCMYRMSALENGVISDCDATFGLNQKYKYAVWGRLWEDISSLKCNMDCTSKLDGRVYSACKTQIQACRGVPDACDGSLLGTWVQLDDGIEVQCSPGWDNRRYEVFTNQKIDIETEEGKCENLVSKSYQVLYNNEMVNMRIYVCED